MKHKHRSPGFCSLSSKKIPTVLSQLVCKGNPEQNARLNPSPLLHGFGHAKLGCLSSKCLKFLTPVIGKEQEVPGGQDPPERSAHTFDFLDHPPGICVSATGPNGSRLRALSSASFSALKCCTLLFMIDIVPPSLNNCSPHITLVVLLFLMCSSRWSLHPSFHLHSKPVSYPRQAGLSSASNLSGQLGSYQPRLALHSNHTLLKPMVLCGGLAAGICRKVQL